jgi:hypothetical protein
MHLSGPAVQKAFGYARRIKVLSKGGLGIVDATAINQVISEVKTGNGVVYI